MAGIISALTFMTVVLFVMGLHQLTTSNRDHIKKRIDNLNKSSSEEAVETIKNRPKIDFKNF